MKQNWTHLGHGFSNAMWLAGTLRRYSATSIIRTLFYPEPRSSRLALVKPIHLCACAESVANDLWGAWWQSIEALGYPTDFSSPKPTDLSVGMNASVIVLYTYAIGTIKSGEKNRHFCYPNYFTYLVYWHHPVDKGVRIIEVALYDELDLWLIVC